MSELWRAWGNISMNESECRWVWAYVSMNRSKRRWRWACTWVWAWVDMSMNVCGCRWASVGISRKVSEWRWVLVGAYLKKNIGEWVSTFSVDLWLQVTREALALLCLWSSSLVFSFVSQRSVLLCLRTNTTLTGKCIYVTQHLHWLVSVPLFSTKVYSTKIRVLLLRGPEF